MQPSSTGETDNQITAASLKQPWDKIDRIYEKAAMWEYGYVLNGNAIGSTREDLIWIVAKRAPEISFVWTPEAPEPVLPEQVPFLVDMFRQRELKDARDSAWIGAAVFALGVVLAVVFRSWERISRSFFVVFGAVFIVEGIWRYASARHYTQADAARDASTARFTTWLQKKSLSVYSLTLAACLIVVFIIQELVTPNSIPRAALVKPAVRNGEIWRLFTATLMHGTFLHFWFNFLALLHFSRIVEHTLNRAYVPLVFLITGAIGSVFSVLIYPNTTSVGASGGLMGLLGFITIAARFDRTKYPPKYFRQMIEAIGLMGVFGLFGFAFVDNAGHLGGLVGGLLLGWFFLRHNKQPLATRDKLPSFAGPAALLAVIVVAAFAAYRMLR